MTKVWIHKLCTTLIRYTYWRGLNVEMKSRVKVSFEIFNIASISNEEGHSRKYNAQKFEQPNPGTTSILQNITA